MGCAASVEAVASDGKRLLPEGVAKLDSTEESKAPRADPPVIKEEATPPAGPPASKAPAPEAKPSSQAKGPADGTGAASGASPAANIASAAGKEPDAERFKDGEATVVFVLGKTERIQDQTAFAKIGHVFAFSAIVMPRYLESCQVHTIAHKQKLLSMSLQRQDLSNGGRP